MIQLTRCVRFCLNDPPPPESPAPPDVFLGSSSPLGTFSRSNSLEVGSSDPPKRSNTFSAWPAMSGLGRFYQLQVCCHGEADPQTGYFINITQIDQAVREHVLPLLYQQLIDFPQTDRVPMGLLMQKIWACLQPPLEQTVQHICLELTPFYHLEFGSDAMDQIILRQQYEFAAAHRLHVPALSDDKNKEVFGKCNNPSGHGHNYRLEVAVAAPINEQGHTLDIQQLDDLVDRTVIEKLDHKHLNMDVPQFQTRNPSVENIVQVIHQMLSETLTKEKNFKATLVEVSVWETGKTKCTYRSEQAATQ